MASLDGVEVNPIDEGSDDHDLPVPLVPRSFADDNPSTRPSSPLTVGEEDITSIAHTPVDDPLPSTGDASGDDIPLAAKNLRRSSRHTASTADLHADLAGDNTSVQNTSPDKGSVKVKPTPKKKKNEPKKTPSVPTTAATTLSFLPSLPEHAKTYINDLRFRVPLETHHPEDNVRFHNEAQARETRNRANAHIVRSALHYSEYRSFRDETGAHLHALMGKLEDLLIGDWNLMTVHHKELVDEVKRLRTHQKDLVTANNTTVKFAEDLAARSTTQKEELSDLWEKVGTLNKALDLLQGNGGQAHGKRGRSRSPDTRNVRVRTRDSHDDDIREISRPVPYVSRRSLPPQSRPPGPPRGPPPVSSSARSTNSSRYSRDTTPRYSRDTAPHPPSNGYRKPDSQLPPSNIYRKPDDCLVKLGPMTWRTEVHDMVQVCGIIEDVLRQEAEQARDVIRNLELVRAHFNVNYRFLCFTSSEWAAWFIDMWRDCRARGMTDYSDVNAVLKGPTETLN